MRAGHGVLDASQPGQAKFGGALFAWQQFDAQTETQVGDEIAVIVVAGSAGLMRVIANFRAFLMSVEGLNGIINIAGPREEQNGSDGGTVLLLHPGKG
jgi:hypothetical protein